MLVSVLWAEISNIITEPVFSDRRKNRQPLQETIKDAVFNKNI